MPWVCLWRVRPTQSVSAYSVAICLVLDAMPVKHDILRRPPWAPLCRPCCCPTPELTRPCTAPWRRQLHALAVKSPVSHSLPVGRVTGNSAPSWFVSCPRKVLGRPVALWSRPPSWLNRRREPRYRAAPVGVTSAGISIRFGRSGTKDPGKVSVIVATQWRVDVTTAQPVGRAAAVRVDGASRCWTFTGRSA